MRKLALLSFLVLLSLLLSAFLVLDKPAGISNPNVRADYLLGIDVSHWQGDIDWNAVYSDGYRFAFVKATEGTSYVDSEFQDNMRNASAAGLYVGPYHFAHPDDNSAEDEARFFLSKIEPYMREGYMVPVLDLEDGSSLGKTALSQWVNTFMWLIYNETGVRGIVYTNANYANDYLDSSVTQWPLWIAHYDVSSPDTGVWFGWYFWQNTSQGSVNGISGDVDIDLYNGNIADLYRNFVIHNITVNLPYYDRQGAWGYAYKWWNGRNPHYKDYTDSGGDCANFVSQALIAGGLSLWKGYDGNGSGVYDDSNGTIPYCDYLHQHLVKYQNVRYAYVTTQNFSVPEWLEIGDVVILGNSSGDHWEHATIVVYRNGDEVGLAAHTTDVWNRSLSDFLNSFDLVNYYHIEDGSKENLTVFRVTASALNVRVGPSTDYQVIGTVEEDERYVAFDSYVDSSGRVWWKFFYDDRVGWCAAWYTEKVYGDVVEVNVSSWLNVRDGPSTSNQVVGEAYHGMLFVRIAPSYETSTDIVWYAIYYSSSPSWFAGEYTVNVPELSPVVIIWAVMLLGLVGLRTRSG